MILVGLASVLIFGLPRGAPTSRDHDLLSLQSRWDAGWYVGIASGGYRVGADGHFTNAAFFPSFPAVLRMTATLFRVPRTPEAWAWTGAIVACALFVAAMCYLYLFASERAGSAPGGRGDPLFALSRRLFLRGVLLRVAVSPVVPGQLYPSPEGSGPAGYGVWGLSQA